MTSVASLSSPVAGFVAFPRKSTQITSEEREESGEDPISILVILTYSFFLSLGSNNPIECPSIVVIAAIFSTVFDLSLVN